MLQVKWRPQRREHIGSSALVVDFAINVWDIRKPYLPFAAFESHRDVATGIVWRGSPHILLSTSKVSCWVEKKLTALSHKAVAPSVERPSKYGATLHLTDVGSNPSHLLLSHGIRVEEKI